MSSVQTIDDVVRWRLCLGCGVCAPVCPHQNLRLVDIVQEGIRPEVINPSQCHGCRECMDVCPAYEADYRPHHSRPGIMRELLPAFGPVLEIWEGHASDPEIRFQGSSGGALTALALYCLEQEGMSGVLHIGQNRADPVRNQTRYSRTREELINHTGSRYAPASVCDHIDWVEDAESTSVVIGQPSEITALRKAQLKRPALDHKVGLALSFFCAGSPSTEGTLELLKKLQVPLEELRDMKYRGRGWPGMFATTTKQKSVWQEHVTYQESWGFLQAFRPFAAHMQPDGSGEDADISCGDPWYHAPVPGEPGSSLVVVRTENGRRILQGAINAGYLQLTPAEPWKLAKSQHNLTTKRRTIWGRRMAFRLIGVPLTRLRGLPLFSLWLGLDLRDKARSILGTARRIMVRKLYRPKAKKY